MVLQYVCICGQFKTWSAGRSRGHEKRRGGKVEEAGQVKGKEAEIKIVENCLCFNDVIFQMHTTHWY